MLTIVDEQNRGYALGAADYLTKPIDRDRLRALLARFARRVPETGGADRRGRCGHRAAGLHHALEPRAGRCSEAENGRAALERSAERAWT